jgi:UDP-N-acetylmuramoyl-tripeptide--D-alanyl-D-alanine ligase
MKGWTLGWIAQSLVTRDLAHQPRPEQPVVSFSTDTRTLEPGSVFVPLVGETHDGHDYLQRALDSGAVGVVWGRQEIPEVLRSSGVAIFPVADTTEAYQALGLAHRKACGVRCIGITGSVGKTTTKEFLSHLLEGQYKVHKSSKNFNNDIGVPLTLLGCRPEHDVVIVEMGMRGFGEIARLVRAAEPEIGLITGIGTSHLELLGSREGIARAKGELVAGLPRAGRAVLPAADDFFPLLCELATAPVLTFGTVAGDVAPQSIDREGPGGTDFTMGGRSYHLKPPGRHHLHDLMGALAAAMAFGADPESMLAQLPGLRNPDGRSEWLEIEGARVYLDAYNSAPESLRAALAVVAACPGRRIAVLGDMLELGDVSELAHAAVGDELAGYGISLALCVGPMSKHTVQQARSGGVESAWFSSKEELAQRLRREMRPGDIILVKASRGMALETVVPLLGEGSELLEDGKESIAKTC